MIEEIRFHSADEIAAEAARLASQTVIEILEDHQLATFVLAGGRLPPVANSILSDRYSTAFDWSRIVFLIGDERCVPLDDPQSNWLSALPLLEAHPEIPDDHKLRPPSQLSAEQAAKEYEKTLRSLPSQHKEIPVLDLLWLGIGEDGHTLSLFPHHPDNLKNDHLVIPIHNSPKPPPDRISLSLHALAGVRRAVVFISGESKAPIIGQIASGDHSSPVVQASQTIISHGGHVSWLIDDAAMSAVSGELVFA